MVSGDDDDKKARNGTFIFESIYATKANTDANGVKTPVLGTLQAAFVRRKNIGGHIFDILIRCKCIKYYL